MNKPQSFVHPVPPLYPPLYNESSKTLILGSFPSVKSREMQFFYGHPQNRFWKLLARLFDEEVPQTVEQKKELVLSHNLALWDVIHSCTITGSSDSSIRDVVPNNISVVLQNSNVDRIFANGATAFKLYNKYILPQTNIEAVKLPSTSPANAAWSLEKLTKTWKEIIEI